MFGWVDANSNHDRDEHELQDSSIVTLKDSAHVELLAFIHDSIGAHIITVEVRDSLTLHATFDKPVDPKQPLDTAHFTLHAADSSLVPLKAIVSAREIDKQRNDSVARADSIRARTDTAYRRLYQQQHRVPTDSNARACDSPRGGARALTPSKPVPILDILISLDKPLAAGATYRLDSKDIHNLMGIAASSVRSFTVAEAAAAAAAGKERCGSAVEVGQHARQSAGAQAGASDWATTSTPAAPPSAPADARAGPTTSKKRPPT